MKSKFRLFAIILTIAFCTFNFSNIMLFNAVHATYVEGPITKDAIWTRVDSPYVVSNDIIVYSNATLTIEPGVEVKFGETFSLSIQGKLYANGTIKSITFTSNKERPEAGDWNAIEFSGTQKSTLIGCFVAYAEDGICIDNGNLEIKDSTIGHCQNGINVTDGDLTVRNSIIMENEGNGICVTGNGQVTIQNNTIIANVNGILLTGNQISSVSINQNRVSANKQSGIRIDADTHSDITIVNNNVSSNDIGFRILTPTSTYIGNNSISFNTIGILYDNGNHAANFNDIYDNQMGMEVATNVTVNAERNYWGDPSGPYHESLNPNGRGNRVGGDGVNLDFIFFLTKPISIINSRPTATLLTDRISVRPNEDVMFFATNSFDNDGRVDRYFFNFGDGSNSGWTTVSVFTHEYSWTQTYYASLIVMDDYGATNNSITTPISVRNFPSLHVSVDLSDSTVHEGEQVSVTAYVTDGSSAMENATVTMLSVKDGNFTESSGLTDATGYFATTFTAPDVTEKANVRIIARASKTSYTDGSDYEYLEVSPFLSVQIIANPSIVKSEETAQISIYVKSNEEFVANASITILSSDGSLSAETGVTDSSGTFSLVLSAPQTVTVLNITITTTATKSGYMDGTGQTIITVEPKTLAVQIITKSNTTISEARLDVIVHVEYDMIPMEGASITMTTENGNFSATTGLTNSDGNATFIFTAPPVNEQFKILITAQATKAGYAQGQSQLEITVNPRTFIIQISAPTVESEESAGITVQVTCKEDATLVSGALVTMSSSDGSFRTITGITDSTGICTFIFDAPQTTAQISITITANVTKNGYANAGNQTSMTIMPKIAQAEGWSITTILLIIIPILIAVVIIVLIKLKIIVISTKEEE